MLMAPKITANAIFWMIVLLSPRNSFRTDAILVSSVARSTSSPIFKSMLKNMVPVIKLPLSRRPDILVCLFHMFLSYHIFLFICSENVKCGRLRQSTSSRECTSLEFPGISCYIKKLRKTWASSLRSSGALHTDRKPGRYFPYEL